MVDGPVQSTDHELTEINREQVRSFVTTVLVKNQHARLTDFVSETAYTEHSPLRGDGVIALGFALEASDGTNRIIEYQRIHRVLAEGNFVLCVSEGQLEGAHSAFYDLFRLSGEKIVEHWDTCEKIAPKSAWKNKNGKF